MVQQKALVLASSSHTRPAGSGHFSGEQVLRSTLELNCHILKPRARENTGSAAIAASLATTWTAWRATRSLRLAPAVIIYFRKLHFQKCLGPTTIDSTHSVISRLVLLADYLGRSRSPHSPTNGIESSGTE